MPLHVHAFGDPGGEPLVCLHGLTGHGRRFLRLAGLLPGRRLICPDMRGHGRSPSEPPWTTEQHAADVLESMGVQRADWLGFSYGTRIAVAAGSAAPERVRRLVLLDPALHLPPGECLGYAQDQCADESWADEDEFIATVYDAGTLFHTPRELLEEEACEHLERGPDGRLRERYVRAMAVTAWNEMARPAPPLPDVPTLVVLGERSWIQPHVEATETVTVPGGHSVLWESLEGTAAAIRRFLDSADP